VDLMRIVGGRVAFAGEHTSAKHFGSSACGLSVSDDFGGLTHELSFLKGSCMGRIFLGSEPRRRYVSCFRDDLNGVMVLGLVASGLVRW